MKTLRETAETLGYKVRTLREWIINGKLKAEKDNRGRWCIPAEEYARLKAEIEARGTKAIYHLNKVLGFVKEIEKHYAALETLCIKMSDNITLGNNRCIFVTKGIEQFGKEVKAIQDFKYFEHYDREIVQRIAR